jgi:hypothetical protein
LIKENLHKFFGEKAAEMVAEGNYYYDINKCGIGYHGDGERCRVIGVRLGAMIPLHYNWFLKSKAVGKNLRLKCYNGDMYCMSTKTSGTDWKKRSILTLRHSAGCKKYTYIPEKKRWGF